MIAVDQRLARLARLRRLQQQNFRVDWFDPSDEATPDRFAACGDCGEECAAGVSQKTTCWDCVRAGAAYSRVQGSWHLPLREKQIEAERLTPAQRSRLDARLAQLDARRQTAADRRSAPDPIAALVALGETAKFKDYLNLKVPGGRDRYSRLSLPALLDLLTQPLTGCDGLDESEIAKVCRWVLRGLPVRMALRKVNVDAEVSGHAAYSRQRDRFAEMNF